METTDTGIPTTPPPIPIAPPTEEVLKANSRPNKPPRGAGAGAAAGAAAAGDGDGSDPFAGFNNDLDASGEGTDDLYTELRALQPRGDQTIPIKLPKDLKAAFDKEIGTHAVAIAGIMSAISGRMKTSNDILGGTPKMYAGVNGEITALGMTTPQKWVYRLVDETVRNVKNHKSLTTPTTTEDVAAAKGMYADIIKLATTSYADIIGDDYKTSLGGFLPKGVNLGGRFQLLLKYTPGTTISGTGYIRYGNSDEDIKRFSIKENIISMPDGGSMRVLELINGLVGDGKIDFAKADEAKGGKSSIKKRRMSSKKGGRNNSASRKQNKKGGAKARRSQKAGKRMR